MKSSIAKLWVAAALLLSCAYATAQARKPCEDLKSEIAKKMDAKGVTGYSLDIVDKGKEGDAKVVGGCDGGTKSIVYTRTDASPAKPSDAKTPSSPAGKSQ
jgi:uncharacterized protein DUF1161